jgi:hypothetical protein
MPRFREEDFKLNDDLNLAVGRALSSLPESSPTLEEHLSRLLAKSALGFVVSDVAVNMTYDWLRG